LLATKAVHHHSLCLINTLPAGVCSAAWIQELVWDIDSTAARVPWAMIKSHSHMACTCCRLCGWQPPASAVVWPDAGPRMTLGITDSMRMWNASTRHQEPPPLTPPHIAPTCSHKVGCAGVTQAASCMAACCRSMYVPCTTLWTCILVGPRHWQAPQFQSLCCCMCAELNHTRARSSL
jgi:hypothetical protein